MAFVYRSERETSASKSNPNLGPGAYIGLGQRKNKVQNAPFNATSKRKPLSNKNYIPGPGTYSSTNHLYAGFDKIHQESVSLKQQMESGVDQMNIQGAKQTSNFASKVPRFRGGKKATSQNLGPGRYVPEDGWIKENKKPPKAEFQQVQWQRAPNPPSIPSHENVFGYEETKGGDLKRQKNPEKITAGINQDKVGPGQYNIRGTFEKSSKKGVQWKKNKKNRFQSKKQNPNAAEIGPGHYEVEKTDIFPIYKYRQSSVFASRVERATSVQVKKRKKPNFPTGRTRPITAYNNMTKPKLNHFEADLSSDDDQAGPGFYVNHENTSSFHPQNVPQRQQFFGSTVARFDDGKAKGKSKVGPGSYNYQAPDTAKTRASTHYQSRRPPFSSSGQRFVGKKGIEEPGPGSYVAADQEGQSENRKIIPFTKNRAFGSTERRFANVKNVQTPGPGQYKPETNLKQQDKKKGGGNQKSSSSVFLSAVPRNPYDQKAKKDKTPSVGSYDVRQHTIEEHIKKKAGVGFENPLLANLKAKTKVNIPFSSQAKRFGEKVNETDAWLAPGYYEHKATFDENKPKTSKAKAQNFLMSSERFEQKTPDGNPGPGYYNKEDVTSQWYKRSFNMIFTE